MTTNSNATNSNLTYPDGFPMVAEKAIEFSYFLSPQEKEEWRSWLLNASPEQQRELVETLHDIWLDNQKQSLPQNFSNQAFIPGQSTASNTSSASANQFTGFSSKDSTGETRGQSGQNYKENQNYSFANQSQDSLDGARLGTFYTDNLAKAQDNATGDFTLNKNFTQGTSNKQSLSGDYSQSVGVGSGNQTYQNSTLGTSGFNIQDQDFYDREQGLGDSVKEYNYEEEYNRFLEEEKLQNSYGNYKLAQGNFNDDKDLDLEDAPRETNKSKPKITGKTFFGENKYTPNPLLDNKEDGDFDERLDSQDLEDSPLKNNEFDFVEEQAMPKGSLQTDSRQDFVGTKKGTKSKLNSPFHGYQYSDQLRNLYQLYIDSQAQNANLEQELKQRQQEFQRKQAEFLNQVMQVLADTDELKDKSFEMNDRLIELAKEVQRLSNDTQAKGSQSLQSQIDELRKQVARLENDLNLLNRDLRDFVSDCTQKYNQLSEQIVQATNNVYGPHSLNYKLEILEKRLKKIEEQQTLSQSTNGLNKNLDQLKESLKSLSSQADKQNSEDVNASKVTEENQ